MIKRCFYVHPLTSIGFIKRFLPLLIIPVIRSLYMLIVYVEVGLSIWDLAVSAAIIALGILRCRAYTVTMAAERLSIKTGLVFKALTEIAVEKIGCISTESTPITAVFGACRVRIETDADSISFFAYKADAALLVSYTMGSEKKLHRHCWSMRQTVIMSLTRASTLSGLLILSTVINYLGKLLGRRLERAVLDTLTDTAITVGRLIPPAATVIAAIIAAGFGISFLLTLIKNATFAVAQSDCVLHIKQGVIWRRQDYIRRSAINSYALIQPPALRLIKRGYFVASVCGQERITRVTSAVSRPEFNLRKPQRAKRRAYTLPLVLAVLNLLPVTAALIWAREVTVIALIISAVGVAVFLYSMNVRLAGVKRGGVYIGEVIRVKDTVRLTLKDTVVDFRQVECITLRQTPFDRKWQVCTLRVRAKNVAANARNIDIFEAEEITKGHHVK